ncbi:tyrosine-type recombinase/integrase [Streptomyces sp. NPDC003697]
MRAFPPSPTTHPSSHPVRRRPTHRGAGAVQGRQGGERHCTNDLDAPGPRLLGTLVEPRNFTREFNRRCDRAGVRRIRVHDTRHTCASLLAALDVHPRIAMQILRHSEIAVIMEVYTHVPSADTRRVLRKLGKALGGSRQKDGKRKANASRKSGRAGTASKSRHGCCTPLLYKRSEAHSRSREWASDLCRGGGI